VCVQHTTTSGAGAPGASASRAAAWAARRNALLRASARRQPDKSNATIKVARGARQHASTRTTQFVVARARCGARLLHPTPALEKIKLLLERIAPKCQAKAAGVKWRLTGIQLQDRSQTIV
jgi:hypothetical protein